MKKISLTYCLLFFFIAFFTSCIKNDIPYPRSLGKIISFQVQGQIGKTVIDTVNCTVSVNISDTVDLKHVKLLTFEVSDNAVYTPDITEYISLDTAAVYKLNTYPGQQYVWTINATQTIDRYIRADRQVGKAEFNVANKMAVFYVSSDLKNIKINEIQLGPSNSEITPDPREISDFSSRQTVTVTYRDVTESWTLNAYIKDVQVTTSDADAWAVHAYFKGTYVQGIGEPTFMYKKASDSQWTTLPASDIVKDGTDFSAKATGLTPNTAYVYKAVAGDSSGDEVAFTTEDTVQMPNMGFDDWLSTVINGKNTWFPDADLDANYWWDSGNQGANTLGEANPTSPEETFVVKGKASRMETVSVAGQMAGGNVFSGKFGKTIIGPKVGAQVDFGRPFTTRPSKIHGYYWYEPKTINKAKDPYKGLIGHPDRCHIFLMLFDTDGPYAVNTAEGIYLPPYTDDRVIGYADLVDSTSTDGNSYKEFTIDVIYKDSRKPKYCALVAVASYYADYFTGAIGTLMYADEFSFIYDADIKWEE